ncbi:MAG: hypothetical protein AB8B53_08005 [Flavobacteriales bacterium]
MNITLRSKVKAELYEVHSGFNSDLFTYLLPLGAKLLEFGGSETGDMVHLKLPLAGEWKSEIIKHGKTEDSFYFIDVGRTLPFPLQKWRHEHTLQRNGNSTIIIDDMTFSSGFKLLDILIYPGLFLAFWPRTWQYDNYFAK